MSRLRAAWPFLVVVAAPLVLFAPFLLGLRVLYWGTIEFQFYPWQQLATQALRAGHLPLWDPWLGNGAPLLANYQSGVLYPPNWLALLLPLDLAQPWLAALHLAWAGVGMVALARLFKLTALGQAVAGLALGLSQYLVARVSFLSINATVAWLPWLVCLVEYQLQLGQQSAISRRRALAALWLSLAMALQLLAGHAQTTWYTLLLVTAWAIWRLWGARAQGWAAAARTALWCAAPLAIGALVAAAQLLPTAELLQQSSRATAAAYDFVVTYSFSPWRLLTLAAPDLFGNPARTGFFGYGNYWEDAIYVGLLPLLLAIGVVLRRLINRLRRRAAPALAGPAGLVGFLLVVAGVSLLLGLGRNTPVFPFLYWTAPTFNLFQAPTRLMILFVFALSLLAGLGVTSWRPPTGWALYWTRLGAAGAVAMGLIGLLAWLGVSSATANGQHIQALGRAISLAGLVAFGAALLSLIRPVDERRWWPALVLTFVAADLLYANVGLNPGAPPDLYRTPSASAPAIQVALGNHRLFYFPDDEYTLKYGRFVSFKTFGPADLAYGARESLLADVSMLAGVASANNFEPLVSARYANLMDVISTTHALPLLRLMDVAVIASPSAPALEQIAASQPGGVSFYRAPGAPQRLWLPAQVVTVPGPAEALAALAAPGFDPAQTVIIESADFATAPAAFTPSYAALTFSVDQSQPGWALVSDTFYPGWVASVDGQPVPIYHGDYAFQAVPVPAGAHVLVFDYQPASLQVGLRLTALGLLMVLVLAAWSLDWGRGWRRGQAHG